MTQTTHDRPTQRRLGKEAVPRELGVDTLAGAVDRGQRAKSRPSASVAVPRKTMSGAKFIVSWQESEIDRWVWAAMQHVDVEEREDGGYNVEVPEARGAWFAAPTLNRALGGLPAVLFDWAEIKIEDRDDDIPVFDGININPR